jgi:signal transduction histidine kinase
MSHELRTPLYAILDYTELILDSIYGEMPDKMSAPANSPFSNAAGLRTAPDRLLVTAGFLI